MSINKTWAISSAICLPVSVDMRVKPEDKTIIIPLPGDCREQSLPSRVVLPLDSIAWHSPRDFRYGLHAREGNGTSVLTAACSTSVNSARLDAASLCLHPRL